MEKVKNKRIHKRSRQSRWDKDKGKKSAGMQREAAAAAAAREDRRSRENSLDGFEMLVSNQIVLLDGSVHTYYSLPADYPMPPDFRLLPPPSLADSIWPAADAYCPLNPMEGSWPLAVASAAPGYGEEYTVVWADQNAFTMNYHHHHQQQQQQQQQHQHHHHHHQMVVEEEQWKRSKMNDSRPYEVQVLIDKARAHYCRIMQEDPLKGKRYKGLAGRIRCLACGRKSQDFSDAQSLLAHCNSREFSGCAEHMGLQQALANYL